MDTVEHRRKRFFDALWADFVEIAPHAAEIRSALEAAGEDVKNDHVAFRTFAGGPLALERLERHILELGYAPHEDYYFEQKHLHARAYLCAGSPRVFLSELLIDELSPEAQTLIGQCTSSLQPSPGDERVFYAGRLWPALRHADYLALAKESEYAAWLCALGLRANHFTVSVNALRTLSDIQAVLDFVERRGYAINNAGGRVKGSASVHLEQGSTLADRRPIDFDDGTFEVPTCYYEFALRHPLADGTLYDGFVSQSADKIFESTHR